MKRPDLLARFLAKDSGEESPCVEMIGSPMTGRVIPLEQMADHSFAHRVLGDGLAVLPCDGKLYSPVDGIAVNVPDAKQTLGITSAQGAELLIQVGRNTLPLKGAPFSMKILEGQPVKRGQLLLEFDLPALERLGYDLTTPIIVTNGMGYLMKKLGNGVLAHGEALFSLQKLQ